MKLISYDEDEVGVWEIEIEEYFEHEYSFFVRDAEPIEGTYQDAWEEARCRIYIPDELDGCFTWQLRKVEDANA
jgi:hypothetical protein